MEKHKLIYHWNVLNQLDELTIWTIDTKDCLY